MNDDEIFIELKPSEVSLEEIYNTIQTLDKEILAIFYVKDSSLVLRAVLVYWSGGGWFVRASEVSGPGAWGGGGQVFSRNFGNSESQTSDPLLLNTFVPEILELKVKVGEKIISFVPKE